MNYVVYSAKYRKHLNFQLYININVHLLILLCKSLSHSVNTELPVGKFHIFDIQTQVHFKQQ